MAKGWQTRARVVSPGLALVFERMVSDDWLFHVEHLAFDRDAEAFLNYTGSKTWSSRCSTWNIWSSLEADLWRKDFSAHQEASDPVFA
jgi:hypothetical protein